MKPYRISGCIAALIVCTVVLAQPGPDAGQWLNVIDYGASGSEYETIAKTTAGSNVIEVADVGDFQVGQGVQISKAFVHYERKRLWGPDRARGKALKDEVEMRGYDGTSGSWTPFLLEIHPEDPPSFRFTDDIGRSYSEFVPITGDWQPLSGGTEVKFNRREWDGAYLVTFSARDQLITVIEKIEGNTVTLRDPANRSVDDAVMQHNDSDALQACIDKAIAERKNVYFPNGRYRHSHGLVVKDARSITIQGAGAIDTIIDISMAEGTCISLRDGQEVTLRNLRFEGHTGYANKDQCGNMNIRRVPAMWGMYLKGCNAVSIRNTTRVLVDNCHAWHMATEAFYSQGRARVGTNPEPKQYTREITYYRCSVEDCGRNAFNNNDMAENTSMLYCRVRDVGGCSWEGASRFVRLIGNYIRNGGTVAMGNIGSRDERYEILPSGQHIIADNVFETGVNYGGYAIRAAMGANQVIIRNNLFINYGTSAIELMGRTGDRMLPARNNIITGNIMDMTGIEEGALPRCAISVSADGAIVSDNQIYVRGAPDPDVLAIRVQEPAVNVSVVNNLITNCGTGILTARGKALVSEVIAPSTFKVRQTMIPFPARRSHRYRGWSVAWMKGDQPLGLSTIADFDPDTLQFRLVEPRDIKVNDALEIFPADGADWLIEGNTITGCLQPVVLDSYGSGTSIVRNNLISRGGAEGVEEAVAVHGQFTLEGNTVSGFDEEGSVALGLHPDRAGREVAPIFLRNVIQHCAAAVGEEQPGLWGAARTADNLFVGCGTQPK
ncbi:MAG: hypothetical protein J7M38_04940 [Armatimonadetes bacterium]|nr:hypothetical protein [Armatimonadota bacterium]